MGRKKKTVKKKNKRKGSDSESSTSRSSPSVADDLQQLLPDGACGPSKSRRTEITEGDKRRTSLDKRLPYRRLRSTSDVSPVLSKEDDSQSSGFSNPSFQECSKNAPQSEHLAVLNRESDAVSGSGSPRKSLLTLVRDSLTISPKKKSPHRSPVALESPKRKSYEKDEPPRSPNKSEMSSSSTPSKKRKLGYASHTPSGHSRRTNTKSSSASGRSSKDLLYPDESNRASECSLGDKSPNKSKSNTPSRNPTFYDPGEGTSRSPAKSGHKGPWKRFEDAWYKWIRLETGEPFGEDMVPLIGNMDSSNSEEEEEMPERRPLRRRRSKTFTAPYYVWSRANRPPTPPLEPISQFRHWSDVFMQRGVQAARPGSSSRQYESGGPDPVVELNDEDKSILNRAAAVKPDSDRRHVSESREPLAKCLCGNTYLHKMGCSKLISVRQRRKQKRCRQDMPRRF